eukprot:TRINITY_DN4263_c0_g2_i2.p1 TRINITY_DN4263_c0_g2~~TRINITY_DN4263_c0_g2_i2.p1  ORF type:complete len:112 (+),score=3.47 TRINITY_DN4263_c0_g2_i2:585-920(+)
MVCLDTTISTIIKEIDSSFGMHADISGWQNVWSDAGSGNKKDYNIWKGVPLTPEFAVILVLLFSFRYLLVTTLISICLLSFDTRGQNFSLTNFPPIFFLIFIPVFQVGYFF